MGKLNESIAHAIACATVTITVQALPAHVHVLLAAGFMLWAFAGAYLFAGSLESAPLIFLAYWPDCFAFTLFLFMLAGYDLLRVKADEHLQLRSLREEMAEVLRKRGGQNREGRE
ncbi:MAG: hypothetical protein R3F11_28550 [Verrucomicrobiales bacterium]